MPSRLIVDGLVGNIPPLSEKVKEIQDEERELVKYDMERAFDKELPTFYQQNQDYPNRTGAIFVWSRNPSANTRARRWWFAQVKAGRIPTSGGRYKRSGKLGKSFKATFRSRAKSVEIEITTDYPKYRYVVGDFGVGGEKYQIVGHTQTGWYSIARNVNEFFDAVEETFQRTAFRPNQTARFRRSR